MMIDLSEISRFQSDFFMRLPIARWQQFTGDLQESCEFMNFWYIHNAWGWFEFIGESVMLLLLNRLLKTSRQSNYSTVILGDNEYGPFYPESDTHIDLIFLCNTQRLQPKKLSNDSYFIVIIAFDVNMTHWIYDNSFICYKYTQNYTEENAFYLWTQKHDRGTICFTIGITLYV